MSWLESIDHQLFVFINRNCANGLFDTIFPFITDLMKYDWFRFFLLPAILVFWAFKQRMKAIKIIGALIFIAALSDTIGYKVMKENIGRVRPNNHSRIAAILRVPYGPKSGSFPSNHAMTTFALMTLLALCYPQRKLWFFTFASAIALSRVYVGVHFPSDVIGGALLGMSLTMIPYFGFNWVKSYIKRLH